MIFKLESDYDFIWSDTVISFMGKSFVEIFKTWNKALKKGGVICFSIPKKNLWNKIFYSISAWLNKFFPKKNRFIFYYILRFIYFFLKFFYKDVVFEKQYILERSKNIFCPSCFFEDQVVLKNQLIQQGFKIIYIRDRIKSDILTPVHIEIKAMKIL